MAPWIARTPQQHGANLGDDSGSGPGIKTEQNANYPGLTADSPARTAHRFRL